MYSDVIDYKIIGDDMQAVEVTLDPGEGVRAEVGALMYMEQGIEMQTSTGGGIFKGFKRILTGESFFITTFLNNDNVRRHVVFGAPYPGKIIPVDLSQNQNVFYCQKDGFLCCAKGIEIEIALVKKFGAGIFGGEGFILEKLVGDGIAFIHSGGAIVEKDLNPGEIIRVDTGCVVGFGEIVTYDINFIGGFKNALFGGEGVFHATLTGPGKVYLQSLPFARLADRIIAASKYMGRKGTLEAGGIGDSLFGNIVSGSD